MYFAVAHPQLERHQGPALPRRSDVGWRIASRPDGLDDALDDRLDDAREGNFANAARTLDDLWDRLGDFA